MIREAGFSGIVDTIWGVAFLWKTKDKLNVGKRFSVISLKLEIIVGRETGHADPASARQFYTGRMIVEGSKGVYNKVVSALVR